MEENLSQRSEQPTLFDASSTSGNSNQIIITRKFQWQYIALNTLLVLFFGLFIFLLYGTISPMLNATSQNNNQTNPLPKTVQVDVLNASGTSGIGMMLTKQLRLLDIDVVDIGNFSTEVSESFIIDRIGNREQAKQFSQILSLDSSKIIQQISRDYLVNLSLVIGKDYQRFFKHTR